MWDWLDFSVPDVLSDLGSRASAWLSGLPQQLLSPEFLIPAAASAGGFFLQNKALKDAQQKQQQIIDQSIADQSAMQVPVNEAVSRMAYERSAPQVQQETATIGQKLAGGLDDFISKARESMPADARSGRLSSDYTTGLDTMKEGEAARRARINNAWANLTAPTQQQFEQGVRDTGYNTTIGNATSDAGVLARNSSQKINQAQPSGGQLMLGNALQTGGAALATNALLRPKPRDLFDFTKAAKGMWDVAGGV